MRTEEDQPMAKRAKAPTPTPKPQDLPGMEDRAIRALETLAAEYADVRDRRMALNAEEVTLKQRAITLMHQHKKTVYRRHGVEITLQPGEESIRVKVKAPDEAEADDDGERDYPAAPDDEDEPDDAPEADDPDATATLQRIPS